MRTILLTEKDFIGFNPRTYSGKKLDYNINLEIEGNLGWVRFKDIDVAGSIHAKTGTSIKAETSITAGRDIKAGGGIKAGWVIKAGEGIEAGGFAPYLRIG